MNSETITAISNTLIHFTQPTTLATSVSSVTATQPDYKAAVIGSISIIEGTLSTIEKSYPGIGQIIGTTSLLNNLLNIQDSARNQGTIKESDVRLVAADLAGLAGSTTIALAGVLETTVLVGTTVVVATEGVVALVAVGSLLLLGSAVMNIASLAAGNDAHEVPEIKAMNDAVSKFINDLGDAGNALTDALLAPAFWDVFAEKGVDVFTSLFDPLNDLRLALAQDLSLIFDDIKAKFAQAEITRSPIVLDLNGDGIATTNLKGSAYFDHDGNGFAEQTGWINNQDGLLVRDLNNNGKIDNGGELFGSETLLANGQKAANGYLALAELDGNGDKRINSDDAGYTTLKIWQDANGDGQSSANELFSLADKGIQSIAVDYMTTNQTDANGNIIKQTSTFTKTDGSTGLSADIWFQTDKTYTIATEILPETAEIAALPDLAGYGNVYSLHQAMLRDSSGHLQDLVQQFINETDTTARHALITPLIYAWTGTENIDPASRSTYVYGNAIGDARIVASLEAVLGEAYLGTWCWGERDPNPNRPASVILTQAFNELGNTFYAQLMAQTHFKPLFDSVSIAWDASSGQFVLDVTDTVSLLETIYTSQTNAASTISDFVNVLKLNGDAGQEILAALRATGDLEGDNFAVLLGSLGLNFLIGDAQDNALYGINEDESLLGMAGNDQLYGSGGNDILDGGLGNDILQGGAGNDTYRFNSGGGQDTIFDTDSNDSLVLGVGINPADVVLTRSDYDLVLTIKGSSDQLTLQNFGGGRAYQIEQIQFADGTVWSLTDLYAQLAKMPIVGTKGADTLFGWADAPNTLQGLDGNDTLYGFNGDDILNGDAGKDMLYGSSGNDTLDGGNGNDMLDGGEGNDYLLGGIGDDALKGGDGQDSLVGYNNNDTLNGGNDNDDLDGGNGADILMGDAGNDSLRGNNDNDTLNGGSGNDSLWGERGDDNLDGGAGDDNLDGGLGNDTLIGGLGNDKLQGGNGNDVLVSDTGNDQLIGGAGNDIFKFLSEANYSIDIINDFSKGQDRIDLSVIDANSATFGKDTFSFIGNQTFNSTDATGQLRFDPVLHILSGSTDADNQAEFTIHLVGINGLSITDFIL